ncbi:MAG: hypothetical protein AAF998_11310 [Bacteroidota bacterium]
MKKIITIHIGGTGISLGERFWEYMFYLNRKQSESEVLNRFGWIRGVHYFPYGMYVDTGYLGTWGVDYLNKDGSYRQSHLRGSLAPTTGWDTTGSYAFGLSEGGILAYRIIRLLRKIEDNEEIEGFMLCMSAAGGAGSGIGAAVLERLKMIYPEKKVVSLVVYDSVRESRAPLSFIYNQLFLTQKLAEFSDATIVLDNHVIVKKAESAFRSAVPNYWRWNQILEKVVFRIMTQFFSEYSTLPGLVDTMVQKPGCSFLTTSFTPIIGIGQDPVYAQSVDGMLDRAFSFADLLVDIGRKVDRHEDTFLGVNQIVGGKSGDKVSTSHAVWMITNQRMNALNIWPAISTLPLYKRTGSKLQERPHDVTLLMNSPSISKDFLVHRILDPFDRLYARKAFVHHTKSYYLNEQHFLEAREKLGFLVQDYETEIKTVNQMIVDFRDQR